MLEIIEVEVVEVVRIVKWSIDSKDVRIVKQDESDGDLEFTSAIGFGGKSSKSLGTNKKNHENKRECVEITKTWYWNLMLDRRILRTKERLVKHGSFRPQEVVRHEVWIGGI